MTTENNANHSLLQQKQCFLGNRNVIDFVIMSFDGRELTVLVRELTENADASTLPIAPTAKFQVANPPIVDFSVSEFSQLFKYSRVCF